MGELGRIVIAGGAGFLGRSLCSALYLAARETVVLTRSPRPGQRGVRMVLWDGATAGAWARELDGAAAVVNLSGEPVAQRLTREARRRILDSRVLSTRAIGAALASCASPAPVWLNASGVGIYGDRGDEPLTEASSIGGSGFLVELAREWEAAGSSSAPAGTRFVPLRIGMVLGREGGAFPVLMKVVRAFAGGSLGSGRQWVSWIHVEDLTALILFALRAGLQGPVNAVVPEPVRNADFMTELRRAVRRPWSPPAPALVLRLAAAFGAPDPELSLQSQRALPRAALDAGFAFRYPDLRSALANLTARA
jgi:uncharacterized protein (TIGR01777 family)